MKRLLYFSIKYPRLIIGLLLVITLITCSYIPGIHLQLDGRSLIPKGHPDLTQSDQAADLFDLKDIIVLGIQAEKQNDIYTQQTLSKIAKLSQELQHIDGVIPNSVKSLATVPRFSIEDQVIDLIPLISQHRESSAFPVQQIKNETEKLGLNDGVLINPYHKAAAIYANVEPDKNRYDLLEQVRNICQEASEEGTVVHFSGTALAQAVLGQAVLEDLIILIPIVIALLAALLFLVYRHYIPPLVALLEVGLSVLLTMGFIGLSGQPIFITTLVLPIILLVIGLSDDVYALNHFFGTAVKNSGKAPISEVVKNSFEDVSKPIEFTAITTITGLLSLTFTNLLPLKIFGFFGALSIAISSILTFSLVPAVLILLKPKVRKEKKSNLFLKRKLQQLLNRLYLIKPWQMLTCIVIVTILSGLSIAWKLKVDDSWIGNLSKRSELVQADKVLNELFAGTTTLDLMIDSKIPNGLEDQDLFEHLALIESNLSHIPSIGGIQSVYSDVVRINASLNDLHFSDHQIALNVGEAELQNRDIVQSLLLLSSLKYAPTNNRIDPKHQSTWLTVFISSANYRIIDEILHAVRTNLPKNMSVIPFGDGWISYITVKLLVQGQIQSITLALLMDFFLVWFLLKSMRLALLVIIPVAFSVLLVFALLALSGIALGIANSMFAAIALGIGIDYTIHLVADFQNKIKTGFGARDAMQSTFEKTGPPIIISAVVVAIGFSVLLFSQILPNASLGLLISISLLICAGTTIIFVPGFSRWLK